MGRGMSPRATFLRQAASLALAVALGGLAVPASAQDGSASSRDGRRFRNVGEAMSSARTSADRAVRSICSGCGNTGAARSGRDIPNSSLLVGTEQDPTPDGPIDELAPLPMPAPRAVAPAAGYGTVEPVRPSRTASVVRPVPVPPPAPGRAPLLRQGSPRP